MIELREIEVQHGAKDIVKAVTLQVASGTRTALLGRSGSGKTTILRAIAGFEPITAGSIQLRGVQVSSNGETTAPELRQIGYVFQDPSLFPHLTIMDNIGFGLSSLPTEQRTERITELANKLDLSPLLSRFPHQCSGGQQQRVALARTLAPGPDIVLLDEPFSGLDRELRADLCLHVAELFDELAITAVMVTHDIDEALSFAQQVAVIEDGRLLQVSDAATLLQSPINSRVARLLGDGCLLRGTAQSGTINCALGSLPFPPGLSAQDNDDVEIWVRPQDLRVQDVGELSVTVVNTRQTRFGYEHRVRVNDVDLTVHSNQARKAGDRLTIEVSSTLLAWQRTGN
ncbi:MAG: ABC transporter ATP-binding protein [Lysobacteraceae bacterium]|nr:MAG: ABC transporter ATP-binding protein [Xanthomonadaceae bacterium]